MPKEPPLQRARRPISRGLRCIGLLVAVVGVLACGTMLFYLFRPVYWKIYAEVMHSTEAKEAFAAAHAATEAMVDSIAGRQGVPQQSLGNTAAVDTGTGTGALGISTTGSAAGVNGLAIGSGGVQVGHLGSRTKRPADLSKLTPQQLELERQQAREQQWEDQWFDDYLKYEEGRRSKVARDWNLMEQKNLKEHNRTLTKQLVQDLAQNGYLVVTWANHHYTQFALSWVQHARSVNITGFIVGAMDDEILVELAKRGVNTFSMSSGLTTGDFGWGSKTFAKMGRQKIRLIATFLKLGVQVVIADVDVVWLRNPLPYFDRYPDADVLTSSDHLTNTVPGEELEKFAEAGSAFNIGIMLFREKSLPFVQEWIRMIEADDNIWDQNAFNDLARRGMKILPSDPNHYFLADNATLTMGVLPVALFCSGHTYFTQRMPDRLKLYPYAVHATFQFSGTDGKRHRFRERQLWHDPWQYYKSEGGYIAFDLHMPEALLERARPLTGKMDLANVQGHFRAVNHQLRQIRHGLALATVLNRTLILPPLWCGLDRWWAPHAGTIPGSSFKLPFICPLDHVLDLEGGMSKQWHEPDFGPHIPFREYSFLNNSRLSEVVRSNVASIHMCKRGQPGCNDGQSPAVVERNRVALAEKLDSNAIKLALSSVQHMSILRFSNLVDAFGNFTQIQDWTRFYRRMQQYSSVWCCIDAHPGHIHYDMWWDLPGHTDKFGRTWGKWEPKTGP